MKDIRKDTNVYSTEKYKKNYYYRKPFTDYSIKTLYLYSQFKKGVIWIYVQQM